MSIVCLVAFALIGQEPIRKAQSPIWAKVVEFKAEPIKVGADGVEIVSIRMKIHPEFHIYATPQPDEILRSVEMRLTIKSKDPKTQSEVRYPKAIEVKEGSIHWTKYEGNIVITGLVRRAKGDTSQLECTFRLHGSNYTR
ncbi:MAG: hypothetical protein EXS16_04670 [Gemmataceae bacterium]|nr:hypothetical protein [Gemmataceae bacterium]